VGEAAVPLGLVDGIGHLVPRMQEMFGEKVRLVPLGQRRGLMSRLGFGAAAHAVMDAAEDRAIWARWGL
jgi:serine protease SohB